MAIVSNRVTEAGDVLFIKTDVAAVGVIALLGFIDDTVGEVAPNVFEKKFRYSLDGITWSSWRDLTSANIQAVPVSEEDTLFLEYRYEKQQDGADLEFNSITVTGNYTDVSGCGYYFNQSIFKEFFNCDDLEVLGWYLNVTEKLYKLNLIPEYISRINETGSSEDYITFWKSIAKYFAYFVVYSRKYKNFYQNVVLANEYLNQRGLETSIYDTITDLNYLISNYNYEIASRGTTRIYEKKEDGAIVNGELLRYLDYKEGDEFLFNLYKLEHFGWNIGNSSPLYKGMWLNENVNKWYEQNFIEDINKYPLIGAGASIVTDAGIETLLIADTGGIGFNGSSNYNPIAIDSRMDYVFEFLIKAQLTTNITIGIDSFDKNGNSIVSYSNIDGSVENNFVENAQFPRDDKYYLVKCVVYNYTKTPFIQDKLNIGTGNNLIFSTGSNFVMPRITVSGGTAQIKSINFLPLFTNYSRGFVQTRNFIGLWADTQFGSEDVVPCGNPTLYSGGPAFPSVFQVQLGSGTGIVVLDVDSGIVPDKYIMKINGEEVINTGYTGDPGQQNGLNNALAGYGLPPETISPGGAQYAIYNKTNPEAQDAIIEVYAPQSGTAWRVMARCPTVNPLSEFFAYSYSDGSPTMPYQISQAGDLYIDSPLGDSGTAMRPLVSLDLKLLNTYSNPYRVIVSISNTGVGPTPVIHPPFEILYNNVMNPTDIVNLSIPTPYRGITIRTEAV